VQPILDTRPIWLGRPELIYQRYLADKEAWLTAHPEVQLAEYRTARGLKRYQKRWLNENRRNLGFQRLNLETETLSSIIDSPNWTDEEVTAWLDWDAQETILVEEQVEVELVAAGGFGQGRERGIRGLWGQIEGNIQAEREQYRFR
jgi:hypothetical protein